MAVLKKDIVRNGVGSLSPIGVCIHSTGNPGATAKNHRDYWKSLKDSGVYAHSVVDWKEGYQCVNYNRKCYHVGNGNSKYIGLEICEAKNKDDFNKGWTLAVEATVEMLKAIGKSPKDGSTLVSHDWVRRNLGGTDHTDPVPYFKKYGKTWANFVSDVVAKFGGSSSTGSSSSSGSSKPSTGSSTSTSSSKIGVDGKWGPATTKRLQKVLGTGQDGIVSAQYAVYKASNPGCLSSTFQWQNSPKKGGSDVIRALQKKLGVSADGYIGPSTIKALQKRMGTGQDGKISNPSPCVKAMQTKLNNNTI